MCMGKIAEAKIRNQGYYILFEFHVATTAIGYPLSQSLKLVQVQS